LFNFESEPLLLQHIFGFDSLWVDLGPTICLYDLNNLVLVVEVLASATRRGGGCNVLVLMLL
jgi:hypothetical protein